MIQKSQIILDGFHQRHKCQSFFALATFGAFLLLSSCHTTEMSTKELSVIDASVNNLELLATRAWLKEFSHGSLTDIPKFIVADNMCLKPSLVGVNNSAPLTCAPAKVRLTKSGDSRIVQILLSPGADKNKVISLMRKSVSINSLKGLTLSRDDIARFQKSIDTLIKENPSIQEAIAKGWISREGKTYPSLENLFSNSANKSNEIRAYMKSILLSAFTSSTDWDGITILTFKEKGAKM
jgi:hypothetical protein